MKSFAGYLEAISQINKLGNGRTVQWLFHCGMLFSSRNKWWGDFKYRSSCHEGIDITYYRTSGDVVHWFDDAIKIPAMKKGRLLNVCDDFLGQTLVVAHEKSLVSKRQALFVYAHIIPEKNLKIGQTIKKEQVIARVCSTHKNPLLPPHLHFSCFEVDQRIPSRHLNWDFFSKSLEIKWVHPVFL